MYRRKLDETPVSNASFQKAILLIDDDDDEHEIFFSALMNINQSFEFTAAENCEEALDILKELIPDYIFIDVNMPRINGITCLQEIKKIGKIKHVPVYMYSTGMNAHDNQTAIQMGAIDYLLKPNSITLLSNLLKDIIN